MAQALHFDLDGVATMMTNAATQPFAQAAAATPDVAVIFAAERDDKLRNRSASAAHTVGVGPSTRHSPTRTVRIGSDQLVPSETVVNHYLNGSADSIYAFWQALPRLLTRSR